MRRLLTLDYLSHAQREACRRIAPAVNSLTVLLRLIETSSTSKTADRGRRRRLFRSALKKTKSSCKTNMMAGVFVVDMVSPMAMSLCTCAWLFFAACFLTFLLDCLYDRVMIIAPLCWPARMFLAGWLVGGWNKKNKCYCFIPDKLRSVGRPEYSVHCRVLDRDWRRR